MNIHSPDDTDKDLAFHPRVQWDAILPDDFDAAETKNPKEAIEQHIQTSEYDLDDTMHLFEIPAPITTTTNINTEDIDH